MHKLYPYKSNHNFHIQGEVKKEGTTIFLEYQAIGDTTQITWPKFKAMSGPHNELYHQTCLEFFLSDGSRYYEWNFSPCGRWGGYAFSSYREEVAIDKHVMQPSHLFAHDNHFYAEIDISFITDQDELNGSLNAVIIGQDQSTSYWAIEHLGPEQADFHILESFKLSIC